MNALSKAWVVLGAAGLLLGLCACGEDAPPREPAPAVEAVEAEAPPPSPEERVMEGAGEEAVRALAAERGAVRPEDVGALKLGDVAWVLVRADPAAGPIYGSNPYTHDSNIRTAAAHSGLLSPGELGVLRVTLLHHPGEHEASLAYGVQSRTWGEFPVSYRLELPVTGD